jgi:hypothetical protein
VLGPPVSGNVLWAAPQHPAAGKRAYAAGAASTVGQHGAGVVCEAWPQPAGLDLQQGKIAGDTASVWALIVAHPHLHSPPSKTWFNALVLLLF